MENKKQRLQSIAILLLIIAQIISQIKMNSYVRDMNSLWESQIEINRGFCNHIDSFLTTQSTFLDFQSECLAFQEKVLDSLKNVERNQKY